MKKLLTTLIIIQLGIISTYSQTTEFDLSYIWNNPTCNPYVDDPSGFYDNWKVSHGTPNVYESQGFYNNAELSARFLSGDIDEKSEGLFIAYNFLSTHSYDITLYVAKASSSEIGIKVFAANNISETTNANCAEDILQIVNSKQEIYGSAAVTGSASSNNLQVVNVSNFTPNNNYNKFWIHSWAPYYGYSSSFVINYISITDNGLIEEPCDIPETITLNTDLTSEGNYDAEASVSVNLTTGFRYLASGNLKFNAKIVEGCAKSKMVILGEIKNKDLSNLEKKMIEERAAEGIDNMSDFGKHSSIYPNPTDGIFTVEIENMKTPANIEVCNMTGKVILSKSTLESKKIDISNQPNGIYLVKTTIGNKVFTEKIIKQ